MSDFYDLPAEERGYWYDRAERETGSSFHDLPAEERSYYYERAESEAVGGEGVHVRSLIGLRCPRCGRQRDVPRQPPYPCRCPRPSRNSLAGRRE